MIGNGCTLRSERSLGDHFQRTPHQNLLGRRNRFVQERFQYVTTTAILRWVHTLQPPKDLLAENLQIVWLNVNYHFEVALSFAGLIGAEAQLAVDVELTHIGIVLGNLSKWIE